MPHQQNGRQRENASNAMWSLLPIERGRSSALVRTAPPIGSGTTIRCHLRLNCEAWKTLPFAVRGFASLRLTDEAHSAIYRRIERAGLSESKEVAVTP